MRKRLLELMGGIGIDEDACNGCGNCEVVCPGNYELLCLGVEGAGTLVVRGGVAVFVSAERCRRDLPESTCSLCRDACPLEAVYYPEREGFSRLEEEVLLRGRCTGCGACAAVCPEGAVEVDEYPGLVRKCTRCGLCLVHCPAMHPQEERPLREPLGDCLKLLSARARSWLSSTAQDGGVVSAVLAHSLEWGIIDAAVVAGVGAQPWKPVPVVATTPEEVLAAAGTKYANSPTLAGIREALELGFRRLGVVALPCQLEAIERLVESEAGRELHNIVALKIALFCKANLHYEGMVRLASSHGFSLREVRKFAIKGRWMLAVTSRGVVRIPLKEALRYTRPACSLCADLTGAGADFSIGAVGSPEGYSTVLIRNHRALGIFADMLREGLLEARGVEDSGLALLLRLASRKLQDSGAARAEKRRAAALPGGGTY
ncbi:MAG: 4Fe-4S dicluster domain-containing protein [Euryarchaeota archaeon]|nr:4Fe-4S dicluster domain-containing protein [Euryarchaeota archaeon]